jgi:hypothetical protein
MPVEQLSRECYFLWSASSAACFNSWSACTSKPMAFSACPRSSSLSMARASSVYRYASVICCCAAARFGWRFASIFATGFCAKASPAKTSAAITTPHHDSFCFVTGFLSLGKGELGDGTESRLGLPKDSRAQSEGLQPGHREKDLVLLRVVFLCLMAERVHQTSGRIEGVVETCLDQAGEFRFG